VGRIAAGTPLLAQENIEDHITLDPRLLKGPVDRLFALRVQGDSMVDAGILDGDYIVVRHQDDAADGSIVVVLIDDEATVKYLFREPGLVRLQPANSAMKPIFFREEDGAEPQIQGVVVAILRTL
jgi:repressor LexA